MPGRHMHTLAALVALSVSAAAQAGVIHIEASGDVSGATDTAALQAALDASAADPDVVIKLGEGTFYISGGVRGNVFLGTITGVSTEGTEIVAAGDCTVDNRGSIILIVDGAATIKDLSITAPDGVLCKDTSPFLFVSDGGAAIDIFGGSATIEAVRITSNGPILDFVADPSASLESGVLLHNCDGDFTLRESTFTGVKRAFVFNPELPSQCDLDISENLFDNNRGGVHLWGGNFGVKGGNIGTATVARNLFDDNWVGEVLGLIVDYPVVVSENVILHPDLDVGNGTIQFDSGNAPVTITENYTDGRGSFATISLLNHTGGGEISQNVVTGASQVGRGAIGLNFTDGVLITGNDLRENAFIPGWEVPGFTSSGAYALFESTNVTVTGELLPASAAGTCQVLDLPDFEPSNVVDASIGRCASPPPE